MLESTLEYLSVHCNVVICDFKISLQKKRTSIIKRKELRKIKTHPDVCFYPNTMHNHGYTTLWNKNGKPRTLQSAQGICKITPGARHWPRQVPVTTSFLWMRRFSSIGWSVAPIPSIVSSAQFSSKNWTTLQGDANGTMLHRSRWFI